MITESTVAFLAEALCTRTSDHTDDGIPCSACRKEAALIAGRTAGAEPAPHAYVSTACIHGLHHRCRRVCKYGGEPCLCACGHAPAPTVHEGGTDVRTDR